MNPPRPLDIPHIPPTYEITRFFWRDIRAWISRWGRFGLRFSARVRAYDPSDHLVAVRWLARALARRARPGALPLNAH